MADNGFRVKGFNIVSSGTPSINSPINLNLNANTVAISTNLSVGGKFTSNITFAGSNYLNFENNSIKIGCQAGFNSTYENVYNTFIGYQAGLSAGSGSANNSIGLLAGANNSTGSLNNFIGSYAGFYNTVGCRNNFIGYQSGLCNQSGNNNNFIGYQSGLFNQSGNCNVSFGLCSGRGMTGLDNVYIGTLSGGYANDGRCNIAIGYNSGLFVGCNVVAGIAHTSINNIMIGCEAGLLSHGAQSNVFIGTSSGCLSNIGSSDSSSSANLFLGTYSGRVSRRSSCSIFMGLCAGYYAGEITASPVVNNIFLGNGSGRCARRSSYSIHLGLLSGELAGCYSNAVAENNVLIGTESGRNLKIGNCNVAIGIAAGKSAYRVVGNTSAYPNDAVFIGTAAGAYAGGCCNVYIGKFAGLGNSNCINGGYFNVSIGAYSGACINGGVGNTLIGAAAGICLSNGCLNTIVGRSAAICLSSGGGNTIIGSSAGCAVNSDLNVFIGDRAGCSYTTGCQNIAIGVCAAATAGSGTCNNIDIGGVPGSGSPFNNTNLNDSGRITIGTVNSTNFYTKMTAYADNNGVGKPVYINPSFLSFSNGMGGWEVYYYTSSKKYKENIEPFLSGIEEILKLNPVTWTGKSANKNRENELNSRRDIGFIAEDVHESELNYFVSLDSDGNPDSVYYEKISVLAVNAIKELHEEQKLLKARIAELENLVNNN